MSALQVRFRVDLGAACAVGPGKVALLEGIHQSGSLSQAARNLGMSYRRAWELLESLNATFRTPVATLVVGGRGGGGAEITAFGHRLIDTYRAFESDLEQRARQRFRAISRAARNPSVGAAAQRRPINLKIAPPARPSRPRA